MFGKRKASKEVNDIVDEVSKLGDKWSALYKKEEELVKKWYDLYKKVEADNVNLKNELMLTKKALKHLGISEETLNKAKEEVKE